MDINNLNLDSEGFYLHEEGTIIKGMAVFSLKIALESFFSTYNSMKNHFNLKKSEDPDDYIYSPSYYKAYFETIIHFQHFFELVIKDFLRNENELLILQKLKNITILHKLLNKEEVPQETLSKSHTKERNHESARLRYS